MLSLHFASLSVCFYVWGISDIALGLERVVLCRPLVSSESQWNNSPLVIRARCSRDIFVYTSMPSCCDWATIPEGMLHGLVAAAMPLQTGWSHPNCLRPGHNYCRCAREQDCPSVWLVVRPSCDHCRCASVQGWSPGKGDDLEGCQVGWSESHFED